MSLLMVLYTSYAFLMLKCLCCRGIHFDSFPTGHDTQMISHSIGGLLDLLWKCWYGEIHPSVSFQRIHVVKPRVPQQSNSNLSCNYVCLFALGIFKTRNKDHTVLHFQSDMKENVTENANFKFNENDVNEFKKQLSVTVMALHSLPNVSNASAKKIQCQTPPNHRTVTQSTKEKNNEFHSALKSPVSSVSHTIGTKVTNGTGNKAVEREANRKYKANERRHKFILNVVIAKLKADGNQNVLLPRQLQKFIKVWIGDHKGSFVEVRQLTQTAMLPHPNDKSRKIFGIIVLHHDERWGLDIIEYERVQCHRSVYFESFVAVQQTDWMKFQKNSLPVAVVRCGVETKLVTQSSISNVTPAQGRTKKAPDRLSSDDSGKLTWEDNKGSLKSAGSTCSEVHFNKVYYGSFVGSDGVLCASNRKVQQNLRSGEIDNALREAIKSRGRGMDSRGNPVGGSRHDKSYDELSKDPLAMKRMQVSLLFEMVKGIRNLSLVSHPDSPPHIANRRRVLPVNRNSSNPSRPLPTRKKSSECNRNTTKELPNNRKRPSSPLKVDVNREPAKRKKRSLSTKCNRNTTKERPNNKKRPPSPLKAPSSTTKKLPSPLKMPSHPSSPLNDNVKCKPPKQAEWTCKHDGCTRQALLKYYHFCGLHRKIVLCSKCKKSQSKCKGGLCRGCFNKSYSEEEIREMKMCVECKVRVSRKMGGRCTVCVSFCRQKSYNKKK